MTQVVTFIGYRPAERFDEIPWTQAVIQEAADEAGPWTPLATIELADLPDGIDADPKNPATRDFTTNLGTALDYWYRVIWADGDGNTSQPTLPFQNTLLQAAARDLCSLEDVLGYVPAYRGDDSTTNQKLQQLITAESAQFQSDCGRDIIGRSSSAADRSFDVDRVAAWTRRIEIGDLSTIDDVTVTVLNADGTTSEVVEEAAVVPLYRDARDAADEWEPVTGLSFPAYLPDAPSLRPGQTIVVRGVWGFPSVPPQAREGCAAGVVLRFLGDVAATGNDFAEAADTVSVAGLRTRRTDAIESLRRFVAA